MAAPVVSGIAALARTKWPDKAVYSSRFIMGQVVATGAHAQAYTPMGEGPVSYGGADAFFALTVTPEPELTFEEFWVFDESDRAAGNDSDGRLDAGETIELAVVIRNRWGKADDVKATLSTPSGAAAADPYIDLDIASVNYGAVGSFNKDDNGLIYDEGLLAVGVREPFVLSADTETPNNHIVPITLTMTATNGLDPSDPTQYSFESKFNLIVQRGRELPSIIDSDTVGSAGGELDTDGVVDGVVTLDESALWIVDKPVLVAKNTTLRIAPGAQVQFWSSLPDEAYTVWRAVEMQVEGLLDVTGTASNPVNLFPSPLYPTRAVVIKTGNLRGSMDLEYTNVVNPILCGAAGKLNYNHFSRNYSDFNLRAGGTVSGDSMPRISAWLPGAEYYTGNGRQQGTPVGCAPQIAPIARAGSRRESLQEPIIYARLL